MPATTRAPDPADYHLTSRRQRFEALFTAHSSTVLAYALRRVEVAADAADVIAETFVVAWRRIDDVPSGDEARRGCVSRVHGLLRDAQAAPRGVLVSRHRTPL
ncbi:sigma factor [Jiangella muralis]|uniref:sigma factor n=1 Tax=Jiangella muralis TaxID=702383 RepID=UPI00069E3932|nr:sigma factor [Jiangella muralis]